MAASPRQRTHFIESKEWIEYPGTPGRWLRLTIADVPSHHVGRKEIGRELSAGEIKLVAEIVRINGVVGVRQGDRWPALRRVDGSMTIVERAPANCLPMLEDVTGQLLVMRKNEQLALPRLVHLSGAVSCSDIDLCALETAQEVVLIETRAPRLLAVAKNVDVFGNSSLPSLRYVGGELRLNKRQLSDLGIENPVATELGAEAALRSAAIWRANQQTMEGLLEDEQHAPDQDAGCSLGLGL